MSRPPCAASTESSARSVRCGPTGPLRDRRVRFVIAGPPVAGVAERAAATRRRSAAPAPAGTAATTAGAAASRGEPLLPSVRPRLERVFGVDLGGVRIHTDTEAADMTRQAA